VDCSRIEFPEIAHVAHSRACNDPNWITLEQEALGTDFGIANDARCSASRPKHLR
jgi:hypothetical protein